MATYDFKCSKCGGTFTASAPITATPPTPTCAVCSIPLTRIYNAPGLTFKGDGWGKDGN